MANTFLRSKAVGIYVTISSKRLMTPRFPKALPAIMGMTLPVIMPLRMPCTASVLVSPPCSKYLSSRISSFSAAVSTSLSCISSICSLRLSGTGISFAPLVENS